MAEHGLTRLEMAVNGLTWLEWLQMAAVLAANGWKWLECLEIPGHG